LRSEGLFTKVISQSGSYWSNDCWLAKELEIGEENIVTSFYLDVGDNEININIQHKEGVNQIVSQIEGVERFRDILIKRGCNVRYEVFSGGHSAEGWASTLPTAIQWAFPTRRARQRLTARPPHLICQKHYDYPGGAQALSPLKPSGFRCLIRPQPQIGTNTSLLKPDYLCERFTLFFLYIRALPQSRERHVLQSNTF